MFTYENDLPAFVSARDRGERCEVDEEMYWYFLEVLPPQFMGEVVTLCDGDSIRADFGFAEGAERITAFWKARPTQGDPVYYAQHTNKIARG